jgi:DNA-binding transcriptional MerR regulator
MEEINHSDKGKKLRKKIKSTTLKVIHGLKSKDVIELVESLEGLRIDYDHLYYYEHTGLVVPSIRAGQGRGKPKLYSVEDFIILRWLIILQKKGVSVKRFREVVDFLKMKMPDVLKRPQNWVLFTDGNKVQFFDKVSSRTVEILEDSGQYLFAFPLEKVIRESKEEIKRIFEKKNRKPT